MLDVNTVSQYPTHILRGVELVKGATKEYSLASENWPYPTEYKFGIPADRYYGEIWINGMDWQPNYWAIEEYDLDKPICEPLIVFEDNADREKLHDYDFSMLIMGALFYRRDQKFINKNDLGVYTDITWPFINIVDEEVKYDKMIKVSFEHASQEKVEFWMNIDFIPDNVIERSKMDFQEIYVLEIIEDLDYVE